MLVPIFATATYLAGLIAVWGVLSLALDRDVIDYPDAGPLLGPAIATAASVVTFACSRWAVIARSPGLPLAASAVLVFVAAPLTGGVSYSITKGSFLWVPEAAAHFAVAPFLSGAALLSAVIVAAVWGLSQPGKAS